MFYMLKMYTVFCSMLLAGTKFLWEKKKKTEAGHRVDVDVTHCNCCFCEEVLENANMQ